MLEDLKKLPRLSWGYERRSTTAAVATVAVLTGLAARALVPSSTVPAGPGPVIAAGLGAYVVLRLGAASGLSKRLKHEVLDRFGGDVDDAQTWLLGTLGGVGTLVGLRAVASGTRRLTASARRTPGRTRPTR